MAALSGAKIAVVPTRHQLLITEPIDGVDTTQPITRIIDVNVYARPDDGGLMLGGYEQTIAGSDAQALPARFDVADLPLDLGVLRGFRAGFGSRAVAGIPARAARDRVARLRIAADCRP